jgi:hypothetical protein
MTFSDQRSNVQKARPVRDTRLRNPFLRPMDLNRRTHYGFRRTRSEMRDSEGRLVESLVDHAHTQFARTTRPQWSTVEESRCKTEPVSMQALSEAQSWMKWKRLLDNPPRSTVWQRRLQDYRLPSRRLCNNPSCHACCTRRRRNAEAFRRTCYLPALAKGIRMQAASSCLRHSIQN